MQQLSPSSPLSPARQHSHGGVGGAPWEVEADISSLLSKHSVEEVRRIEQRTRLDIERKKEELRQMVGERYRDLIDAADSIMELETGSKQVGGSLGHMIKVCQSLQQTHFLRGLGGMRGPPVRDEAREVTAQMKLLGDAPEKIWHCLENQQYLEATKLFLAARHTHTQLQVSLARNTLLQRLWQATSGFKSTILECCRRHLQATDPKTHAMLSSLCAIVLLENCSLRQVFSQFLLAQKVAIQAVFHPSKQMHYSVKAQLSEAVLVIRHSILLIASLFVLRPAQGSSLLLQAVKDFTADLQRESIPTSLRTTVSEVPSDDLQSLCLEWLAACVEDVKEGVRPLLSHVTSVRALSNIRSSLHSLLSQPEKAEGTPSSSSSSRPPPPVDKGSWPDEWQRISRLVFARDDVSIWHQFLQSLIKDRAMAILTKHFAAAGEHAVNSLRRLLDNLTSDPARYSNDIIMTSQLWVEEGVGKGGRGGERKPTSLTLKSRGCTPSVYSFCKEVGGMLDVVVEDVTHYLCPQDVARGGSTHQLARDEEGFPFRLHGDHNEMQEFLCRSTVEFIKRFLSQVLKTVDELRQQLEKQMNQLTSTVADRLLVVARVCQALSEFCPPLSLLARGCKPSPPTNLLTARHRNLGHRTAKQKEDPETNTFAQLLALQCSSIHKVWADSCAQQFVMKYRDQLGNSSELNALSCSLVWDEINIVEEAESGKQVSSTIKVPSQASVYVTSLLFAACQEISRIGGHTMERSVLQHFSGQCLRGVLEVHRSFLRGSDPTAPLRQSCALQLLFNVRFISSILSSPPDMEEDTEILQTQVLELLHGHIDPFDLSVFTPHLLSALERQLHRSTVLLGLLLSLRGPAHQMLSGHKPPQSSSTEKHIVLPLFPATPRFPSLPTSTQGLETKPVTKPQFSKDDVKLPRSFMETVEFFHHL